jgi:hypothetical protein
MTQVLEIAQDASIRGMRVDGVDLFSVYDFIMHVCPGRNSCYSTTLWKRLILKDSQSCQNDMTANAVVPEWQPCKFSGERQRDTPCMTILGLQKLLLVLGSKAAVEFRDRVLESFNRVLAGDRTLLRAVEPSPLDSTQTRTERRKAHKKRWDVANRDRAKAKGEASYSAACALQKAKHRAYYLANKDSKNAKSRAYYLANKDHKKAVMKAWSVANPDRVKAANKAWSVANPDRVKAANKAWREANPDRVKAWKEANPDRMKQYRANAEALRAPLSANRARAKALNDRAV